MKHLQSFVAPTRGDIGEALLRFGLTRPADVANGHLATITTYTETGARTGYFSRRAALWLLLSLPAPLDNYQLGAVAKGYGFRVEYEDMNGYTVLGVYPYRGSAPFFRGLYGFLRKGHKAYIKYLQNRVRRNEALLLEARQVEADLLRSYTEQEEAFTLYVEGGATL